MGWEEKLKAGILVHFGCYNKLPYTGWFKQQIFVSDISEGWEAQDQNVSRYGS